MATVTELKKLIKPAFTEKQLKALGLPPEEVRIFLNYKIFPIAILVKASWNYKEEDEYKSSKLQANLKRNGQVENIQVRELETGYYEVVNGNHRLDDSIAIGKEYLIAYDHGKISQAEAKRIAIETNETKFASDHDKLSELIQEIAAEFTEDELKETLPFTEEELEGFMGSFSFDGAMGGSGEGADDGFTPPDDIDQIETDFVLGDLIQIGPHRLICGDSEQADVWNRVLDGAKPRLMVTDPPYGVEYDPTWRMEAGVLPGGGRLRMACR